MANVDYSKLYSGTLGEEQDLGKQQEDLQAQYIKGLQEQTATYEQMPQKLQQAFETGKGALQSQAAQALAQSKVVRGGKGLAAARGTAIQSGQAISQLGTQNEMAKAEALQQAAKAKTSLAAEQEKLVTAKQTKAAEVQAATALVQQIIDDESGVFVTTPADRKRMAARFQSEVMAQYANNPQALAAATQAFNNAMGNKESTALFGSL